MTDEMTSGKFAVLEVFGVKLEVSNQRLAELLTMDASAMLKPDFSGMMSPKADRTMFAEALPSSIIVPPTPQTTFAERNRLQMRGEVDELGAELGFTVGESGAWDSPTGIRIATRVVDRPLTVAAATHFVTEVSSVVGIADPDAAVLFVVADHETADVFRFAIRQRRLHHLMRTVTIQDLLRLRDMVVKGGIDHRRTVVLLAPVADIDVGEMLSVLHANATGDDVVEAD